MFVLLLGIFSLWGCPKKTEVTTTPEVQQEESPIAGQAPAEHVLLRTIIGGAHDPRVEDLTEEEEGLRLRDVLIALRLRLSTAQSLLPLFEFPALLAFPPEPVPKLCSLLALVHGDSAGEQAVTLVLREEVSTLISPPQN